MRNLASSGKAQLAAGGLAAAGAAAAGKLAVDRLRDDAPDDGQSRAYRLKAGEEPRDGIRRIANGRAHNALEELGQASPESVHEARKDLKKIRAVLRLVRRELGGELYRAENSRYRDAGRRLAAARDAEVKLETLASLQEQFPGVLPEGDVAEYRGELERERSATAEAIGKQAGPAKEAAAAIAAGRERIAEWPLDSSGWKLLGPGLTRSYRRGRKCMKRVRTDPSTENVHDWRKRAKDLWYQLRIVREAWPQVIGPLGDEAHELGELLGDHHDLAVLAAGAQSEQIVELTSRRRQELLEEALQLGDRLYAEKPKAFDRRLESYWRA